MTLHTLILCARSVWTTLKFSWAASRSNKYHLSVSRQAGSLCLKIVSFVLLHKVPSPASALLMTFKFTCVLYMNLKQTVRLKSHNIIHNLKQLFFKYWLYHYNITYLLHSYISNSNTIRKLNSSEWRQRHRTLWNIRQPDKYFGFQRNGTVTYGDLPAVRQQDSFLLVVLLILTTQFGKPSSRRTSLAIKNIRYSLANRGTQCFAPIYKIPYYVKKSLLVQYRLCRAHRTWTVIRNFMTYFVSSLVRNAEQSHCLYDRNFGQDPKQNTSKLYYFIRQETKIVMMCSDTKVAGGRLLSINVKTTLNCYSQRCVTPSHGSRGWRIFHRT